MSSAERYWFRIGPPVVTASQVSLLAILDPYTGETHFLSDLPLILLDVITDQPSTIEQIGSSLSDGVLDSAAQERIGAALEALRQAEIVDFGSFRASLSDQ